MITGTDKNPSFGLAADGKPENVPNGHLHVEIDTFKASLYDEENNTWYEDESGGGGGGLPDITAEDNGYFPVAKNGAWDKIGGYMVESQTDTVVIYAENTITLKNGGEANISGFANAPSDGDTLMVMWNGQSYECEASALSGEALKCGAVGILTGNPDWSVYPFCLILPLSTSGGGIAMAESNGSATLSISKIATTQTVTVSDDFKAAVEASGSGGGTIVLTINQNLEVSETWQTIYNAIASGTRVVFNSQNVEEGYAEIQVLDITYVYGGSGSYGVEGGENFQAVCTSADAHPVVQS